MKNKNLAFTINYNGLARSLNTKIGIMAPFVGGIPSQAELNPNMYNAIWDTGATGSVITARVAVDLGLKPIGMTRVSTAGGMVDQNEYLVSIFLPNRVFVPNVRVTEGKLSGIDILVGMDIISLGDFCVTNHLGRTVLSFRMPSSHTIDYVKEHQISQLPRAQRREMEKKLRKEQQ